ncbi:N-acetyltransferase [Nitratireductor sp. CAU 1489]|uniref:N-acetyltransferase n=2 Tax=Nitratireductor arenosus TaxID=2682096 RepID=A0A844QQ06_9HYPH|nr:N-acetyltransferase [Nitratireductor arenosus]
MDILWGGPRDPELNRALALWCAVQIGLPRPFEEPYTTMGVMKDGTVVGVVVFNNWQPEAGVIEMHSAATTPRWLTRPVLKAMFGYAFHQAGAQMVVTRVSERDSRLLRIFTAYGFDHVTIPRLRGREEGERIFFLTDDAWLSNRFNARERHPIASKKTVEDQYIG